MKKENIKKLVFFCILVLCVGFLSFILTINDFKYYEEFVIKPKLTPPNAVFGIVWSILYLIMGISLYLVSESNNELKKKAINIFSIQLFFNFFWTILFFKFRLFLFSFIWLILLWIFIIWMIILFYKINKKAGILQIPYFLWVTFASYLNLMVFILNK